MPLTDFRFSRGISKDTSGNIFLSQYILLVLIDIFNEFDLSDETGRENLQNVVVYLLTKHPCDENQVKSLVKISETLIPRSSDRLQFYVDIVKSIINPIHVESSSLIATCEMDASTEIEVASLKMKLFELKEEETKCHRMKEYDKLIDIKREISLCNEKLTNAITPFLPRGSVRIFI